MGSRFTATKFLGLALFFFSSFSLFAADGPSVTLSVDASDAPRKMFHAQLRIPAKPGTLTLYYPKWIPGEHGPDGPIANLTGLRIEGGGENHSVAARPGRRLQVSC